MSIHSLVHLTPGLYTWSPPAALINGSVRATVYGSPGQWPGGGATVGGGLGAQITGNIPVVAGVDTYDLYVADGGANGWGGSYGLHHGAAGGAGQGTGHAGGYGGSSSAVVRVSDTATMIEAAGGGGSGGFETSANLPYIAGAGGSAGMGIGIQGNPGVNGGSIGIGGDPIGGGGAATTAAPGAGGVAPAGSTSSAQAGTPTSTGVGGNAGATGDSTNCGGGGGGGGGFFGGGGGAGGMASGGGGGGGAGLGVVDPSVYGVVFAGYSYLYGSITLIWSEADPPLAPTLTAPANNAYVDLAVTPTFSFVYRPYLDSGSLNQWAFWNVTTSMYWNALTQAWSGTIVWNDVSFLVPGTSNLFSYTFPDGAFTDGTTYQWSVACTESYYNLGTSSPAFASAFTAHAAAAPAVTVTAPTFGSDVNTVTPAVTWTETLSASPQTTYRVLVYNSAQTGQVSFVPGRSAAFFDTGVVSSTALTASPGPLPPDTYQAFVQVADNNGETNPWGSAGSWTEFTVRLINYTTPAFDADAGVDPDNAAPVTVLTVTPSDSPTAVSVEYSDDGGTTWLPVLGAWMLPYSAGTVTAYDYTIPLAGQTRQYRAEENGTVTISSVTYPAVSDWATDSCAVTAARTWLSDPLAGGGAPPAAGSLGLHRITVSSTSSSTSTDVTLDTSLEEDQPEQQGTFLAFGNPIPITVRGDMYVPGLTGLAMLFQGQEEFDTFVQIRQRRRTLVLRTDQGDVYFGILGPSRPADLLRATDRLTNPYRVLAVSFTPAAIPSV